MSRPELKQLLGALVFSATQPVTIRELRKCLAEVAERVGGDARVFGDAKTRDIRMALEELGSDIEKARLGFSLVEVAGGYRLNSEPSCGRWVRNLLNADRPRRLSVPALETLAIIAYRQPVSKAEIEGVRGVNVDHMIKTLMEIQLVRIVGRSELPGRPFLFGTTHHFLEHFGLRDLNDLSQMDPSLLRAAEEKKKPGGAGPRPAEDTSADLVESDGDDAEDEGDDDDPDA